MLKPICLSFLVLCVFTLCGCGGNSEVEQLRLEITELKNSTASNERLELVETSIKEGDEKCTATINESIGKMSERVQHVESITLSFSSKAEDAEKNSATALASSKQVKDEFGAFRGSIETLYERQKETLRQIETGFQTRLAGTEQKFKNEVTLLETQLRGKEAELSSFVAKELQGMENKVATFRTELIGKLAEEHGHTEKMRTENAGFKASLDSALEQVKTLEVGFRKHLEDEVGKMNLQYARNQRDFLALKNRVNAYGKQLSRIRMMISSILTEFEEVEEVEDEDGED